MALCKNKTLPNGVTVSYWRIFRINSVMRDKSEVFVAGFVNKAASDNGCDPLDVYTFVLDIPKQAFIDGNVLQVAYTLVKQSRVERRLELVIDENDNISEAYVDVETNFFVDAADCLEVI